MIFCYINNFICGFERVGGRCFYSKKPSFSQKNSNFAFFSKCIVNKMKLRLTNIKIKILRLLLILLGITNMVFANISIQIECKFDILVFF